MLDRIKDILKAELNDKLHQFTNFKSLEDLEIDEILSKLKKEYEEKGNKKTSTSSEQEYTYEQQYSQSSQYQKSENNKEKEYYKALELPQGADFAAIKKSYRKLMKVYHPDLYHNDKEKFEMAKEVSQKLNESYVYFKNKYEK